MWYSPLRLFLLLCFYLPSSTTSRSYLNDISGVCCEVKGCVIVFHNETIYSYLLDFLTVVIKILNTIHQCITFCVSGIMLQWQQANLGIPSSQCLPSSECIQYLVAIVSHEYTALFPAGRAQKSTKGRPLPGIVAQFL